MAGRRQMQWSTGVVHVCRVGRMCGRKQNYAPLHPMPYALIHAMPHALCHAMAPTLPALLTTQERTALS